MINSHYQTDHGGYTIYVKHCLFHFSYKFVWNLSDKSVDFSERILSVGLYKDFFEYLSSKTFSPESITDDLMEKSVQGMLDTLHNVVQKAKNAREEYRKCQAVDVLQRFREATDHQVNNIKTFHVQL